MHIEDLKRWHWIIISLIVGLALGSIYASTAAEGGSAERRTIGPAEFLWRLTQTTRDKNNQSIPLIRNVKVYPAIDNKQVVTLEELVITVDRQTRARSGEYQERQFVAEIPFTLASRRPPRDPNWSIENELKQRKAEYKYVALASKPMVYTMAMGGSLLLIGIIWPTIQNYLQTRGYGHAPKAKEVKESLWKARPTPSKPTRPATPLGPTRQDMEQLAAVTRQYEQNVAGMAMVDAAQESKSGIAAQTARKWDNVAVDQPKAVEQEREEHEYGGEFYPVDRGVKKKQ